MTIELGDGKVFMQEIVRSPHGSRVRLTYEDGSMIEADLTNIKDVPSETPPAAKRLDKAWGDLHVDCLAAWRKINFPAKLDYQVTADMLADCSKPKESPSLAKRLEAMDNGFVSRKSICEEYEAHDAKPLDYIAACGISPYNGHTKELWEAAGKREAATRNLSEPPTGAYPNMLQGVPIREVVDFPVEAASGWEYRPGKRLPLPLSDSNVAAFEAAKAKVLAKFASVGVRVGPNKNGDIFVFDGDGGNKMTLADNDGVVATLTAHFSGDESPLPESKETCTCSTFLLMAAGCSCGAFQREQS